MVETWQKVLGMVGIAAGLGYLVYEKTKAFAVYGKLTYMDTGEPAVGSTVRIGGKSDTADVSGRYRIEGAPAGMHDIYFLPARDEYQPLVATVKIYEDFNLDCAFYRK